MAIEPLYSTKEELMKRVRVSTANDEQSLALIDQKIQEVRLGFYSSLGLERAIAIAGYTSSENPTTSDEVTRSIAETTEANWLTILLSRSLPVNFITNEGQTRDSWNDEPLTRDAEDIKKFIEGLQADVNKALGLLESPENPNAGQFQSSAIGADEPSLNSKKFVGLHSGTNEAYRL